MAARNTGGRKPASIRTLWAIAKSPELRLTDEDLHAVVYRETGKESMKKLSQGEINTVARVLQNMKDGVERDTKAKRIDEGGNAQTEKQRRKIYALCDELGWNDDPRRLAGFVKRVTQVDRVEWLTIAQCNKVIEGLKGILARQRKKEVMSNGCKEKAAHAAGKGRESTDQEETPRRRRSSAGQAEAQPQEVRP